MNNIDRVFRKNYIPTDEDLLLIRYSTLGMTEKIFGMGPKPDIFKFVDVGGRPNGMTVQQIYSDCIVFCLCCGWLYVTIFLRETKMDTFF